MRQREKGRSRDAGEKSERRNAVMKKLGILLVLFGIVMMGAAWGTVAADGEELDVVVVRARGGQYAEAARDGQLQVDVAVIRGRQGWTYESAAHSAPWLDAAVIRARSGQYAEAARGEPQLDIVAIRGRQHRSLQSAAASMLFETTSP
jgi:hypothetical protein